MPTSEQIKFACPNGHPLSCPREMIGKPGKCPKCNTKFVVPDIPDEEEEAAEEPEAQEHGFGLKIDTSPPNQRGKTPAAPSLPLPSAGGSPGAPKPAPTPVSTGSSVGSGNSGKLTPAGSGPQPGPDLIVFLCPNGHRLNGPKKLQGKPGQCPHCGAKFVIPLEEEEEQRSEPSAEAEPAPAKSVPQSRPVSDSTEVDPEELDQLEEVEEFPEGEAEWPGGVAPLGESPAERVEVRAEEVVAEVKIPPPPAGSHPLATLLARLWQQPSSGRRVQVDLDGGETITPEFYCREFSYTGYAVFAVRLDDGTHTVISVPWEKVARITVRGVKDLPKGFE